MNSKSLFGLLCVAACFFLVGSSYPIAQDAMNNIPTWIFMFVTFLISLVLLIPLSIYFDKTNWLNFGLKNWIEVSVLSLLGAVLYTVFLLYGMEGTSAVSASVITSAAPILVLLLSIFFLKEKSNMKKVISILLAIASIIIMTVPAQGSDSKSSTIIGLVLIFLSTLSNASNIIFSKKVSSEIKPITLATGVCLMGTVFSLPPALFEINQTTTYLISQNVGILVYYGIFVWAAAYLLFYKGINYISATSTGMCVAIIPFSTMITSVLFYHYQIKETDIISTVLIAASIIISEINFSKKKKNNVLSSDNSLIS